MKTTTEQIINYELQEIHNQVLFESTNIVYEHMMEEKEQGEWWKTIGPGYDDE